MANAAWVERQIDGILSSLRQAGLYDDGAVKSAVLAVKRYIWNEVSKYGIKDQVFMGPDGPTPDRGATLNLLMGLTGWCARSEVRISTAPLHVFRGVEERAGGVPLVSGINATRPVDANEWLHAARAADGLLNEILAFLANQCDEAIPDEWAGWTWEDCNKVPRRLLLHMHGRSEAMIDATFFRAVWGEEDKEEGAVRQAINRANTFLEEMGWHRRLSKARDKERCVRWIASTD
jgi:hypothetical protein